MSTISDIPALLRSHGLRLTPQRLTVAGLVLTKPAHVTARSVYQQLKDGHPALSLNTVYLTLGQFESCGLLNRFEIKGSSVFDSNITPHDHASCNTCGMIMDISSNQPAVPSLPAVLDQWLVTDEQRVWIGLCPACQQKQAARAS